DISGTITNGIQTKEFSIPLGEAGSIGLEFAFDPIIIEYDGRKRMEKESIIQLKGGSGRGKITLCLGPSKLITTQVCGDIDLYARLQKSTTPGCDYEYVFGFGSSNFYTKTKVAGVENNYPHF
ncbi:MAG: hypothetical protein HC815_41780, partial [Richelia sp. RM1_1_1]|nr:hypothetical protein [Richelia sp. RM1_1_1]